MLHFLTGMYYFTWFENLLIIIAGLSLGHFLNLIVRQVIAIRNGRSLTKIIRTMIPWLVLLLVLMLSPVFASGIAVGWMVIIGLLECVIEQAVLTKFGQQLTQQRAEHRPAQQHAEHLVHRHSSDRPVERSAAKQSHTPEHEQSVKSNSAAEQAQSAESAAKSAAPAAQQPVKSAESASTAERQSPAVTNQAASTTATTESQPETSTPESHQPTSQEIMDHMFDFDPNVDYEAEAKAAAAADRQNQEENEHGKD